MKKTNYIFIISQKMVMVMVQTFIYEYLGVGDDPIYQSLSQLVKGQRVMLGSIQVTFNHLGLYEVETDESHNCFSNIDNCYERICELNGDYEII